MRLVQEKWLRWRSVSANRRILAASVTVGVCTLLVKIAGAAKVLVVASRFGVSDALDAFLIAFLLPAFAAEVVAGAMHAAFLPTWIRVREREGPEAAGRLLAGILISSSALLAGFAALLAVFAGPLLGVMGSGFSPAKLDMARDLFHALLPVLFLSGLGATWRGILNARGRFALAASVPILTPATTMVVVILFGARWGAASLAAGTLAGCLIETAVLAWGMRREGLPILPGWHGFDPHLRLVLRQYAPTIVSALALSGLSVVDQAMAGMLGPGSLSALSYGGKLLTVLMGVGPLALGTAVLPHFSEMAARREWTGVRQTLFTYSWHVMAVAAPVTVCLVWFSEPLVRLLYERGAFSPSDTPLVSRVQAFYLMQLPFAMLSTLVVRIVSSLRANQLLVWSSLAALAANVLLNWVLMRRLGVAGIALSSVLVSAGYFLSVAYVLWRLLGRLPEAEPEPGPVEVLEAACGARANLP